MCGSFCTHSKSLRALGSIVGEGWDVLPVMSECVWDTDTRFGTSEELKKRVTELAGCEIIHTVKEAERLGPEIALEYMIIAPCTGNTARQARLRDNGYGGMHGGKGTHEVGAPSSDRACFK